MPENYNHNDLMRSLGNVEGKLDALHENIARMETRLVEKHVTLATEQTALELRVNNLEQARAKLWGAILGISALGGVAVGWLKSHVNIL